MTATGQDLMAADTGALNATTTVAPPFKYQSGPSAVLDIRDPTTACTVQDPADQSI